MRGNHFLTQIQILRESRIVTEREDLRWLHQSDKTSVGNRQAGTEPKSKQQRSPAAGLLLRRSITPVERKWERYEERGRERYLKTAGSPSGAEGNDCARAVTFMGKWSHVLTEASVCPKARLNTVNATQTVVSLWGPQPQHSFTVSADCWMSSPAPAASLYDSTISPLNKTDWFSSFSSFMVSSQRAVWRNIPFIWLLVRYIFSLFLLDVDSEEANGGQGMKEGPPERSLDSVCWSAYSGGSGTAFLGKNKSLAW